MPGIIFSPVDLLRKRKVITLTVKEVGKKRCGPAGVCMFHEVTMTGSISVSEIVVWLAPSNERVACSSGVS